MVSPAGSSVHVVALAGRTPVGLTPETSAAAVRAGISSIEEHPFLVDPSGDPLLCACDPGLDPDLLGWRRIATLTETSLEQLGRRLATTPLARVPRASLLLGLPEHRPGWTPEHAKSLLATLGAREFPGLPRLAVEDVARGHASVVYGLGVAYTRIQAGALDWCIVGGADSYLDADTLQWLAEHRQLETADTRSSLIPGEAAGFVVVASGGLTRSLGISSLAQIVGVGSAYEQARIKTEDVNLGRGLSAAVAQSCAPLARAQRQVDEVYCDINGERYRSEEWSFALLEVQHLLRDGTDYHLLSSSWGDVGAASGALFVTAAARAWRRRYARGSSALAWASSESGLRAAAVLSQSFQR